MAHLVIYRRGQELMRMALDRSPLTIGRGPESGLVIPDPEVARELAVVEWAESGYRVRDRSGRGLRLGGAPVEEAVLEDGVDLALGQFRAVYLDELPEAAATDAGRGALTRAGPAPGADVPRELGVFLAGARSPLRSLGQSLEIGSGSQAGLRLDQPTVSARHCKLHRHGGRLLLTDLGSTNGTWVEGLRVYEVELPLATRFRVGPQELVVRPLGGSSEERVEGGEFEGLISQDPAMQALFAQVQRVAASNAPVAIFGETGSGKELVARALHRRSGRAAAPLIPMNCAAIARELMESELFGHERGAFTGAASERAGALAEAHGGTLFLDEVGELPLELQPKLLRAVDLGEVKKVGAARPTLVDVRFICATHRQLPEEVRQRRFREDLYYRLAVATLFVPPLRQRRGDLPLLWDHFVRRLAPPGVRLSLSPAARQKLDGHGWPGNVRELRNVVQRALLASRGAEVQADDLQFDGGPPPPSEDGQLDPTRMTLEQMEKAAILAVLRHLQGNRRASAQSLGIARSTLQKKLADYGLGAEEG